MTAQDSLTLQIADALAACDVAYLLAGSFASNWWGIPRSTKDADFVLQLSGGVGADFAAKLGPDFDLDLQLSFETVTGTYRQCVHHRKGPFKIELFLLSPDAHDQERFARRREQDLFGRRLWLLSPEDVVISKLRWARTKDEDDVRNVMTVQREKLDWPYIEKWCAVHGTLDSMNEIRRSVPEI